jgi:hypothetical protein
MEIMQIDIVGGSNEQQELCYDFAHHVTRSLCGPRLYRTLNIDLALDRDLGALGSAAPVDDSPRPKYFDVEIEGNLQKRPMLQVLGHELVHVKQYAKGDLRSLQRGGYSWQGTKYNHITPDREIWSKEYNRLPWEIEARGMEEVLFIEWCEDRGITDTWAILDLYEH